MISDIPDLLLAGAVTVTTGGGVTVNVAVAVFVSHLSVAVKVTVTLPPVQSAGAAGALLVKTGAQPPAALAPDNQVWYAAFSAA